MYTNVTSYLTLIFFSFTYILIDTGMERANAEIIKYMMQMKDIDRIQAAEDNQADRSIVRKKLTSYKCKFF